MLPSASNVKSVFLASSIRACTSGLGGGTGSACIPTSADLYAKLTLRSGQATAMPSLVIISISSTRFDVKAAAWSECWSCGSGLGGAAANAAAGVVASGAAGAAGAAGAKRPSLDTAADVAPPAGVHAKEYMVGSTG